MIEGIIVFIVVLLFAMYGTYMSHDDSWNNRYSKRKNAWGNIAIVAFMMFLAAFASHCFGIKAGMELEARSILIDGKSHYKIVETPSSRDVVEKRSRIVEEE